MIALAAVTWWALAGWLAATFTVTAVVVCALRAGRQPDQLPGDRGLL